MADREATKQSPSSGDKDTAAPAAAAPAVVDDQKEEESSASEYEEIIEEVTDYSEAESDVKAEINVKSEKAPIKEAPKKEEKSSSSSITSTTETISSAVEQSQKEEVVSETETKSEVKIVSETINETETVTEIVEEEQESNKQDVVKVEQEQKQQQKLSSSTTEKTETKEKDGAVVTTTTKVTTRTVTGSAAKPVSPFNKFKQLDSQQSAKSPTTPPTTASPTASGGNQPIFKFTDPALNARAATVKEQLLQWCQSKTQEYENVQITNFSTSWNNGLAFCALIHHFLPDAFDYSQLTPKNRRKNFELAFTVADEKAGIAPLLDVEDMVVMQRPDWKCVFVYVQSIYRRFRNCQ